MTEPTADELRDQCTRFLGWHGRRIAAAYLDELAAHAEIDRYGDGGAVTTLERRIAELLGKPAAVFLPSGTMAQQIALRVHADRRGRRTVAFHPTSHIELFEGGAYHRLHGLVGRPIGDARTLLTIADFEAVAEPLAAVLFELPQREIGGRLPEWDDVLAQTAWAREHGAAVHLDGARLWDCTPHLGLSLAEIAAPFDTVYVSFYKTLGGLAGCCLIGDEEIVAEVREWRGRHGGTLFALWPYAASALAGLETRLPRIPQYYAQAVAFADAVRDLDGVAVVPDPPQMGMFHLHLRTTAEAFRVASRRIAEESGIWTWAQCYPTDNPQWGRVEFTVGDATLEFTAEEFRELVGALVGCAPEGR